VSRITQGKIKLQREPVDISSVIARAIEINRPLIDARHHELTLDLPRDPVRVHGDLTRLAQAIGNLVSNAAKYTEHGGKISVRVERAQSDENTQAQVVIRVTDSGVGIPPQMLPQLFELFTQGERTLDQAQGGLGIGLALVRRLVALHGGTVTAYSEGEGQGSEFVVRLPVLAEESAETPASPKDRHDVATSSKLGRRVLIADDNLDSAQSLAMLLKTTGHVVEVAYDGVQAVEAAERFRPEAVLLDLGMPRLDGEGAARQIRAQPWGQDMVLIALTGWGQKEARDRTREAGFDAHLVKPVEFSALAKLLADPPRGSRCVVV
jgi:CheY-like chemotaxis protein/two-component sensor histidine kinase